MMFFLTNYTKQILIALFLTFIIAEGYYIYKSIQRAAVAELQLSLIKQDLVNKTNEIKFYKDQADIAVSIAQKQKEEIDVLSTQLENLVIDLQDEEEAPASLKEYFKRLKNVK